LQELHKVHSQRGQNAVFLVLQHVVRIVATVFWRV